MAWSLAFKEKLSTGGEPMFALDFASPDLFEDSLTEHRYVLHSHDRQGIGAHEIGHAIAGVSATGQRVTVRTWRSSLGGLRVLLSGADVAQRIRMAIPRGMTAELKVGFAGMDYDEWGTVGVYTFKSLTGSLNSWTMDFDDLFSALQGRTGRTMSARFMKQAGETTETNGTWATTSSTLTVNNTAEFDKDDTVSPAGRGLLYCTPSDGDPFYLKWTEKTATTFTVVTTDVIGTTRTALADDDTITSLGYVFDTVPDIAYMILFGGLAGDGTITMPDNWHMGLKFSSHLVNSMDLNSWRSRFMSLYTDFNGDFITDAPLENPYRGLEEFLSAFGSWLVFKEGGLSWRFVQQIVGYELSEAKSCAEYTITDDDIVSEDAYQLHNPDAPVEYFQIRYAGTSAHHTSEDVGTLPTEFRLIHPSNSRAFDDDVEAFNESNATQNVKHRLSPWYTRIPDQMSLTLRGWKFAELVPGDVVSLHSDYIYDMIHGPDITIADTAFPFKGKIDRFHNGTQYLVTGVDVDWQNFTTSVELSTPPRKSRSF
jgi:hypothetical protein